MRNSERGSAPAAEIPLMFNRINKKGLTDWNKTKLRVSEKKNTFIYLHTFASTVARINQKIKENKM